MLNIKIKLCLLAIAAILMINNTFQQTTTSAITTAATNAVNNATAGINAAVNTAVNTAATSVTGLPSNTCATATLSTSAPKSTSDCTSDKTVTSGNQCCKISFTVSNSTSNICMSIPSNTIAQTAALAAFQAFNAKLDCASSFIEKSILGLFGFLLMLF